MEYSIAVAGQAPKGYPAIFKSDIIGAIKKARSMGYSGIEWHLRQPDFAEAEQIQKLCADLGMAVTGIGTGMGCVLDGLTLMHTDKAVRMQAVTRLKAFIDLGAMLNCLVIIGSMKGRIPPGQGSAMYESHCREALGAVMAYAEKKNVHVVLEIINRYETNFLNTAEQMNAFVRDFGSRLLKAHIDTFHMNIEEPDMCESIEKCKETLGHVHLADSNRWHPGAGHISFAPIIRTLNEIGYKGCAAVECFSYPEPDTAARRAIEYLSSIDTFVT